MGNSADRPAIGVGLGPRNRIRESDRQKVLDAAAVLQLRRSELAAASGDHADVTVVHGYDEINRWLFDAIEASRELQSIRPAGPAHQLRVSLPGNRRLLDGGLKMVSVFDADGLDLEARLLLANEPTGSYLLSVAPVQMKILDRRSVVLAGPAVDGGISLMRTSDTRILEAAWRYWDAASACAFPADEDVDTLGELTPRQRQVVALMASGANDDAVATALGVSVRTVRSEVAAILDTLGVRTRFAAGARLQLWAAGSCNADDEG